VLKGCVNGVPLTRSPELKVSLVVVVVMGFVLLFFEHPPAARTAASPRLRARAETKAIERGLGMGFSS